MLQSTLLENVDRARFTQRMEQVDPQVAERAAAIVADVRANGYAALQRWTKELDGCDLHEPFLSQQTWDELAAACDETVAHAIRNNLARIEQFHQLQVGTDDEIEITAGVKLGRRAVPHKVAACYVPGGRASYPSTILMTVPLARLAGVGRIIVVTPPNANGTVDSAVAYAAKVAGATHVLLAGGAQAIAALAYGNDVVPRADCIVGPGNAYVTAAKKMVADVVSIDSPAGPSELLIIADESANPAFVAADMIAQAEHDSDAQCILVTPSESLAEGVNQAIAQQMKLARRRSIIEASLNAHGAIIVAPSMQEAVDFANDYAAEHLEIQTDAAEEIAGQIRNAGSMFIGAHAPVPIGDYGSGTNHVLPTMGFAKMRGGLCVDDFRKWVTWQNVTREGLGAIASDITTLADAEGLTSHADAVRIRMEEKA